MILSKDRLIRVGKLRKSYGIEGAIRAEVEDAFIGPVHDCDFLFLGLDGDYVPYGVEYSKGEGSTFIIKLEWIDTPEEAGQLSGAEIYLEKDEIPEDITPGAPELLYGYLESYILFDEHKGLIGPVIEVQAFPQQEMLTVNFREKEYLIPIHEDLILSIDENNRKITMQLPEGILED